ncbi:MAG: hypothetical protein QGI14_02695 [Candidatus Poseidonia sp.]|jgi:hypothetical protein|nr:hypothetical protein [Poseidonia sp.]
MDFAVYSLSIIGSFAAARWATENLKFHLRNKRFWVHHWILAAGLMLAMLAIKVEAAWLWGALTGVALEGLRRDNWSLVRAKK